MGISTADSGSQYRAFISYSHLDTLWAQWLHKALESYRVPRRLIGRTTAAGVIPARLLPIFRDRDELPSANDLNSKVNQALAQSANLIVICSPRAAASRWVNEEILAFKRLRRADRIFCLVVDGEPNATDIVGRESEECFAPALRFEIGVDGEPTAQRTEPIAADARLGKDGKKNARLKLIAGMLDVGFDALKQREQQRRNQRLALVTAASFAIMLVTTVLAISAVVARRTAEHREKQAEDLIGFMLGDLHTKLESVNRLDILDDVADKAMGYFSESSDTDSSDDALAVHAKALQMIGRVRQEQGKSDAARTAFEESLHLLKTLVARAPQNPAWQIALADSYSWLGRVAWDRGDLAEALKQFQLTVPLVDGVVAAHPENQEWYKRLGWLHNNVGHVLEAQGEFAQAQHEYQSVLDIYRKLLARTPDDQRIRMEVAYVFGDLGDVAFALGSIDAADENHREALAQWQALAKQDAKNQTVQENLASAYSDLAEGLNARADAAGAREALQTALTIAQHRLSENPTSQDRAGAVARYSRYLARRLRLDGDLDRAEPLNASAQIAYAQLAQKEPLELGWQLGLAANALEGAWLSLARQHNSDASAQALSAHRVLTGLYTKHPENVRIRPVLAECELMLGRLASGNDHVAQSMHWRAALSALDQGPSHAHDPDFLSRRAAALCLLGDSQSAQKLMTELSSLGYRDTQFVQLTVATPCHEFWLSASRN